MDCTVTYQKFAFKGYSLTTEHEKKNKHMGRAPERRDPITFADIAGYVLYE